MEARTILIAVAVVAAVAVIARMTVVDCPFCKEKPCSCLGGLGAYLDSFKEPSGAPAEEPSDMTIQAARRRR